MSFNIQDKDILTKMGKFFITSLIGLVINTLTFIIAFNDAPQIFPIYPLILELKLPARLWEFGSVMIAILVTTLWNFAINKIWTFQDVQTDKNLGVQTTQYLIVGGIGAIENLTIYGILTTFLYVEPIIAEIIAFIVSVFSNFALNYIWTFRSSSN